MSLNSSVHHLPVNLGSRSLTRFSGNPQDFPTCFKNKWAVVSALQRAGAGIQVAYLENLSTTTNMFPRSATFGRPERKESETLCHGREGMGRGMESDQS